MRYLSFNSSPVIFRPCLSVPSCHTVSELAPTGHFSAHPFVVQRWFDPRVTEAAEPPNPFCRRHSIYAPIGERVLTSKLNETA